MSLSRSLKRHRGWIAVAAVVVLGGAALLITRQGQPEASAPTYTTEAAARGTLSVTVDGTGYLAVRDEVEAYPDVSGDVASVEVDEGDAVKAGDVLYTLDDDEVRDAIALAKASRQQASQSLAKAKLELYQARASLSELEARGTAPSSTVAPADLTVAERQVNIAESAVSAASDAYDRAADEYADTLAELDELEVTAPCDGVVWSVNAEEGDAVGASGSSSGTDTGSTAGSASASGGTASSTSAGSSAPVTVARGGLMGVELEINEVDVTTIEPGQDVEVQFDAVSDLTMTGTIDEVARTGTVSSGVVTYSVWLTLDGSDKRLKPGMSATATIVTRVERDALLVPSAAVKTAEDASSYVEVLAQGSSAPSRVTVETGVSSATQTVIASGIEEGALVVTKTTTASTQDDDSSSSQEGPGGIMMMGGGVPGGGPGGQ